MTKIWKFHGGIDGCRTFRNLCLSLPNARPVLVQVDLLQADVGATKWVAPSGPRLPSNQTARELCQVEPAIAMSAPFIWRTEGHDPREPGRFGVELFVDE